jgi:hypothetical protein
MCKKKPVDLIMLLKKFLFFYNLICIKKNKNKNKKKNKKHFEEDVQILKEIYIINEKLNVIAMELELLKELKNN